MKGVGRNTNGTQHVKGFNTFNFTYKKDVSRGKRIACVWFCCDIWLQKDGINRTWIIVGGDRLDYDGMVDHLFEPIKTKYPLKINWTGTKYIGIDLE